jgi:hypothetical protein
MRSPPACASTGKIDYAAAQGSRSLAAKRRSESDSEIQADTLPITTNRKEISE